MRQIVLDLREFKELRQLHPLLWLVLLDVLEVWPDADFVITCIARTPEEDKDLGGSGVHSDGPPWRAADARVHNIGQPAADKVAAHINARWVYDPSRTKLNVAFAAPHGTGPHLHLQVHKLTQRREDPSLHA